MLLFVFRGTREMACSLPEIFFLIFLPFWETKYPLFLITLLRFVLLKEHWEAFQVFRYT